MPHHGSSSRANAFSIVLLLAAIAVLIQTASSELAASARKLGKESSGPTSIYMYYIYKLAFEHLNPNERQFVCTSRQGLCNYGEFMLTGLTGRQQRQFQQEIMSNPKLTTTKPDRDTEAIVKESEFKAINFGLMLGMGATGQPPPGDFYINKIRTEILKPAMASIERLPDSALRTSGESTLGSIRYWAEYAFDARLFESGSHGLPEFQINYFRDWMAAKLPDINSQLAELQWVPGKEARGEFIIESIDYEKSAEAMQKANPQSRLEPDMIRDLIKRSFTSFSSLELDPATYDPVMPLPKEGHKSYIRHLNMLIAIGSTKLDLKAFFGACRR